MIEEHVAPGGGDADVARLLFGDRPPRTTWLALPVALAGFALPPVMRLPLTSRRTMPGVPFSCASATADIGL